MIRMEESDISAEAVATSDGIVLAVYDNATVDGVTDELSTGSGYTVVRPGSPTWKTYDWAIRYYDGKSQLVFDTTGEDDRVQNFLDAGRNAVTANPPDHVEATTREIADQQGWL